MVDFSRDKGVLIDFRDEVVIITLNRVDKLNALDDECIELVCRILEELEGAPIRAAVLTGAGPCFCAGYDIDKIDPDQPLGNPLPDTRFERVVAAIEEFPVPVVAAMDGDVCGGGLDLAMACDFRVARPGIGITITACRLGLACETMSLHRYIAKVGPQVTRLLFLCGGRISIEKAFELGIVDEVLDREVPPLNRALEICAEISRNAPLAVKSIRQSIQKLEIVAMLRPETQAEIDTLRLAAFNSLDLREGLAAWKTRRRPRFLGK
jgi:enoyl-CoA hydratase/carnithine racemase